MSSTPAVSPPQKMARASAARVAVALTAMVLEAGCQSGDEEGMRVLMITVAHDTEELLTVHSWQREGVMMVG